MTFDLQHLVSIIIIISQVISSDLWFLHASFVNIVRRIHEMVTTSVRMNRRTDGQTDSPEYIKPSWTLSGDEVGIINIKILVPYGDERSTLHN